MGVIYKLDFSSGKSYIGQTVRTLRTRITQHRQAVAAGSLLPVHCAWRAHGEPSVSVLHETDSDADLHDLERQAISQHCTLSPDGYNVSCGGDTAPSKSPDVAAKIAAKAIGRVVREDVKQVIRDKMKLRWQDPEYVARVRSGLLAAQNDVLAKGTSDRAKKLWEKRREAGWVMPESTRAKIGANTRAASAETRAKMSESAKKRGVPAATREKAVLAQKGIKRGPYSQERKDKAAAGIKAAWQDPEKRERLMAARKTAWETRRAKRLKESPPG